MEYLNDIYQVPAVVSAKAQTQRSGSMTGDIIINFRKPQGAQPRLILGNVDAEPIILDEARCILIERGGQATRDQLMRGIVSQLMRAGALHNLRDERHVEAVLDAHFEKTGTSTWQLREDTPPGLLSYIPLQSRIRWIVDSVLTAGPATLDDILVAVFTNLKNGRTPDKHEILSVLHELAVPDQKAKPPRWVVRPKQYDSEEAIEAPPESAVTTLDPVDHDRMIAVLARFAQRCKLLCHVGVAERRKNAELEALSQIKQLDFPPFTREQIRESGVDQIDIIWLRKRTIPVALFEVEHTTGVTTCIPRLANLTTMLSTLAIPVFIVGPDALLARTTRKLQTPSGQLLVTGSHGQWFFLPYSKLLRAAEQDPALWTPPSIKDLSNIAVPPKNSD